MVYFGCKVTKKTVIFQNFLQINIKISVFFALYVPNAGGNALFIGKKRGYHTISSRQPLEILHICYQIVHYILLCTRENYCCSIILPPSSMACIFRGIKSW